MSHLPIPVQKSPDTGVLPRRIKRIPPLHNKQINHPRIATALQHRIKTPLATLVQAVQDMEVTPLWGRLNPPREPVLSIVQLTHGVQPL
jgi:hypothetical protein